MLNVIPWKLPQDDQAVVRLDSVKHDLVDSLEALQKRYESQAKIKLDKAEVYRILRIVKAYLKYEGHFWIGRWRRDREWQNQNSGKLSSKPSIIGL
jgi:hypothetical protein